MKKNSVGNSIKINLKKIVTPNFRTFIRNSYPSRIFKFIRDSRAWAVSGFSSPSPYFIKQACILRNGVKNATWVETGTYLGETSELLSKFSEKVYSIEPQKKLYENAKNYFNNFINVEIINGESQKILPDLLLKIEGDINFWLDGHYSGANTYEGVDHTPILEELKIIEITINRFNKICVLIDDIRCFNPSNQQYKGYPKVEELIKWAQRNNLNWHIEHDIFIARNYY